MDLFPTDFHLHKTQGEEHIAEDFVRVVEWRLLLLGCNFKM